MERQFYDKKDTQSVKRGKRVRQELRCIKRQTGYLMPAYEGEKDLYVQITRIRLSGTSHREGVRKRDTRDVFCLQNYSHRTHRGRNTERPRG